MLEILGKYIKCPKEKKIVTITSCLNCVCLAQIQQVSDKVQVECLQGYESLFSIGIYANDIKGPI